MSFPTLTILWFCNRSAVQSNWDTHRGQCCSTPSSMAWAMGQSVPSASLQIVRNYWGGAVDGPEDCAASQRDLHRLEVWAHRNLLAAQAQVIKHQYREPPSLGILKTWLPWTTCPGWPWFEQEVALNDLQEMPSSLGKNSLRNYLVLLWCKGCGFCPSWEEIQSTSFYKSVFPSTFSLLMQNLMCPMEPRTDASET